jgi:hypothetical protein
MSKEYRQEIYRSKNPKVKKIMKRCSKPIATKNSE